MSVPRYDTRWSFLLAAATLILPALAQPQVQADTTDVRYRLKAGLHDAASAAKA